MNWQNIKTKYPKAFERLIKWLACSVEVKIEKTNLVTYVPALPGHVVTRKDTMPLRRLYDFFDEQGIYVWITLPFGTDEGLDIFDGEIRLVNGNYLFERISVCGTKTRTLAEEQAFLQAFKILEDKL